MISGVEIGGSGSSMNRAPSSWGPPSLKAKNSMQENNTILYVDSGRTMSEN